VAAFCPRGGGGGGCLPVFSKTRQIGLAHPSLPNSFIVLSGAYLREETRPRLARSLRDRYFFPRHRDDVPHPFACLRIKLPGQERRGGTRGTGGDNVKRIDGRRGRWRGKNSPSAVSTLPSPRPAAEWRTISWKMHTNPIYCESRCAERPRPGARKFARTKRKFTEERRERPRPGAITRALLRARSDAAVAAVILIHVLMRISAGTGG